MRPLKRKDAMIPNGFNLMPDCSKAAIGLIALALGYMVCARAAQAKGRLKPLGYIIGAVIIVGSCIMLLVKARMTYDRCKSFGRPICYEKMTLREQDFTDLESLPVDTEY